MKIRSRIICLLLVVITIVVVVELVKKNSSSHEYKIPAEYILYWVDAERGARIRDINTHKVVAILPNGTEVHVIKFDKDNVFIDVNGQEYFSLKDYFDWGPIPYYQSF